MNGQTYRQLLILKGLLSEHRQFYRNRLAGNWDLQADQDRDLSLSFLEGEARVCHQALLRTGRALAVVEEIVKELENATE